jgi:hypothetical protein
VDYSASLSYKLTGKSMIYENLSNINPEPVLGGLGRRDIIKAGVLALTPGLALLPQNAFAANTTQTITNLKTRTNTGKLFRAENGLDYYCFGHSFTRAGKTEQCVIFSRGDGNSFGCRTYYDGAGVRQHAHHNYLTTTIGSNGQSITFDTAIHTLPHREVIDGHITTRNLTRTEWILPVDATEISEYYSLVDAGANVVDYVEYILQGITYVKAEVYIYSNNLRDHLWITTYGLSGDKFTKFFELFGKWRAANIGASSRLGTYKKSRLTVAASWGIAVGLAGFTGGTTLAAMGAYTLTATVAGTALNIAQQNDMIAVDEAARNLIAFVKANTNPPV